MIVSDRLMTVLATAAFPTIAVLIGVLVNNLRLNDLARVFEIGFADTNRHIDDMNDLLRVDLLRMQHVIDARLKHLEEHLQR